MSESSLLDRLKLAVANATALGLGKLDSIALLREAAEEIEENDKLHSLQWEADMRGIAMWRDANPGNELVMPDHGHLVAWLLNKITAQKADIETLAMIANNSFRRGFALHMVADQFAFYARQHHDKANDALNAKDVGMAAIARGKAKVNERMEHICRVALGDEVQMTAGDLGGVDWDGLKYPAIPTQGMFCLGCLSQYDCDHDGYCRRKGRGS